MMMQINIDAKPEKPQTVAPVMSSPIIGSSLAVRRMRRTIELVAPSTSPVLVTGPTGAGKELVAEELHRLSGRSGELVAVNCAAIPNDLLESELFGYEKGAFTGADRQRIGRFEQANGGTLFLDEIGDMPLALQAKLLRALETHSIRRLGGNKEIPLDLRVVCATHQDMAKMAEDGRFRADLYYRLAVFPIEVYSLKDRSTDVPLIAEKVLSDHAEQNPSFEPPRFSQAAYDALSQYEWPGNVRELRNVVERAFVMFPGEDITAEHVSQNLLPLCLPDTMMMAEADALWEEAGTLSEGIGLNNIDFSAEPPKPEEFRSWFEHSDKVDLRGYLRDIEVVLIEAALAANDGLVSRAADALGLRRTTLIEKKKKLMIE